ncbi:MAG: 2-oxoacid:acceptor oxidoreductase subunit alpha [Sulfurovum sp.]|nr:2-oxoacid:acceptor oxidoreductase subunit alpha [Sulfurovum sp.]MDD3499679.1 2-oxoacid:acceptor oxidoreductase subunit alpha [Sulfurovum sp.]
MQSHNSINDRNVSVSVSGAGGSGAVTAGLILLKSMANAGYYGYMTRFSGPQIRGGESAVVLNFSDAPVERSARSSDIHFALDWHGFERFSDEIPLNSQSCVIFDNSHDALPDSVASTGAKIIEVNLKDQADQLKGSRPNAFAIGIVASQLGLPLNAVLEALEQVMEKKGGEIFRTASEAVGRGYRLLERDAAPLENWKPVSHTRWNISGNEACALGALRAGVKFAAAYPITPASDIVEYLAPRLEKYGGNVMIAEDELAAMNMVIGGSFGGKPSMTATSGPGFSLMIEAMGLAIASEVPALVINVMRGGPSTGLPTKSEQTDLNQVLFGMHGEAPHVVVAPLSIGDCVVTTQWAVGLAEHLQTLVVLVSDQRLGQSRAIIDAVPSQTFDLKRKILPEQDGKGSYLRYAVTPDFISPMAIPGNAAGRYTADGLEHTVSGKPSSMASDHLQQLKKREAKVTQFDYGRMWAETCFQQESAEIVVLTWGSVYHNTKEAVSELYHEGSPVALLGLRLLMPLQTEAIQAFCEGKKVIVVEQSYSGQLYHYLQGQGAIDASALTLAKPGPLVLGSDEIKAFIKEAAND